MGYNGFQFGFGVSTDATSDHLSFLFFFFVTMSINKGSDIISSLEANGIKYKGFCFFLSCVAAAQHQPQTLRRLCNKVPSLQEEK
jgi:uncharacterized transporter YbjL